MLAEDKVIDETEDAKLIVRLRGPEPPSSASPVRGRKPPARGAGVAKAGNESALPLLAFFLPEGATAVFGHADACRLRVFLTSAELDAQREIQRGAAMAGLDVPANVSGTGNVSPGRFERMADGRVVPKAAADGGAVGSTGSAASAGDGSAAATGSPARRPQTAPTVVSSPSVVPGARPEVMNGALDAGLPISAAAGGAVEVIVQAIDAFDNLATSAAWW